MPPPGHHAVVPPSFVGRDIGSDSVAWAAVVILVLLVLFVALPLAELYVIVQTSHTIGFGDTVALLIVVSVVGAWLAKRQGFKVWRRFNQAVDAGQVPSKEIAEGVCLLLAGALLILPGFITDVVGVLLLLPPSQALMRRTVLKRFAGRGRVIRATYGGAVYDSSARDAEQPPRGELGR